MAGPEDGLSSGAKRTDAAPNLVEDDSQVAAGMLFLTASVVHPLP